MNNFFEALQKYLDETPQETILADWTKSAHLDDVGPTIEDYLGHVQSYRVHTHHPDDLWQFKILNDFSPEFSSGFFISGNFYHYAKSSLFYC